MSAEPMEIPLGKLVTCEHNPNPHSRVRSCVDPRRVAR